MTALTFARLLLDIFSIKLLVWVLGRDGQLLDSHLFFYHRYIELADHYWAKGDTRNAGKYEAIAEAHYQAAPDTDDDPPEAAAMAMPVPQPPAITHAVSTKPLKRRGDPTETTSSSSPA